MDAQLRSVFHQVKFFSNDPKSLGHSDFGPNFSKIIETKTSKKFRAAYCTKDSGECPLKLHADFTELKMCFVVRPDFRLQNKE